MGHSIAGFVGRKELLREETRHLTHAVIASLEQGFGFLPATDDLHDELGDGGSPHDEFWRLSNGLARLGAELSRRGPVAYVETDYFGGTGEQAAMVWENGEVISGPSRSRIGASTVPSSGSASSRAPPTIASTRSASTAIATPTTGPRPRAGRPALRSEGLVATQLFVRL